MAEVVSQAIYKMGVEGQAQVDAAGASVDRLAVSEEKLTRATRTSADSVDRLLGRLDPRIRAEQQLQAALAQVNRFEEEGIGTAERRGQAVAAATAKYNETIQRLSKTGLATSFDQDLAHLDEIAQLRAAQAAEAFTTELNSRMIAGTAKSARDSASAFATELDKIDEIARLKAQEAGQAFSAGLNANFGIDRISKSARDSASVFEQAAAEEAKFAARLEALRAQIDPLAAAENRLNAELLEYSELANRGALSAKEFAAAQNLATERYSQSVQRIQGTNAAGTFLGAGNAAKLSAFQIQNLSFQLQDVGQAIATGQPLFRTFIQQGSQIAQIFGPGVGVAGALKAVGSGILQYVTNPLNLAFLGFAAVAAGAGALFSAIKNGGSSAEDALKQHKDLIDRITAAYGEAGRAATDFAKESSTALRFAATQALEQEQARLQSALSGFASNVTGNRQQSLIGFFGEDADRARAAIAAFIGEIRAGGGNVGAFREELNKIGDESQDARFRKMIQRWLEMTQGLSDLAAQAGQASGAVALLAGVRIPPSAALSAQFDVGFGQTASATDKLREALKALHPKAAADPQQNQFDAALKATQKQTDALVAQAEALGRGVGAVAEYTKQQELLNLAEANHIKLSASQIEGINALAAAYGEATQKLAEMNKLRDLSFERSQLTRSPVEQQVATATRAIYGDDYERQVNGAIAAQIRLNDQIKVSHDLAVDFASGFVSDLRNGVSATEALSNAFGRLGDKLLDIALNQAINSLFGNLLGGLGGGGGGIASGTALGMGGIGHNAAGNDNWRGGLTTINENGGEIVDLPRGTRIIPHDVSMAMAANGGGGGGVSVTYAPSYNVTGSGPEVDALRAEIARDRAEAPARIVRAVKDAQSRRVIK